MDVNGDAYCLNERVALRFFASKLAPTVKELKPSRLMAYGYAGFR